MYKWKNTRRLKRLHFEKRRINIFRYSIMVTCVSTRNTQKDREIVTVHGDFTLILLYCVAQGDFRCNFLRIA
jgi:hypothetical protein